LPTTLLIGNVVGMTIDASAIGAGLLGTVPFARTLGIEFVDVNANAETVTATAALPDAEHVHNHVGGPHAGALYTLGETASGAVVLAAFGAVLDRATPLAVRAEIAYRKLALGTVTATARLGRPAAQVLAELDAGGRPEFDVSIDIVRADGAVTAEMAITWTLRPNR
jgi:acyl-coenzyme A thioesterase PaaI-like protein